MDAVEALLNGNGASRLAEEDKAELIAAAWRISEYQQLKKLSDNALVRKFAGLGSTKTYKRILNADIAELNLEKQLANYRGVLALIENLGGDKEDPEELYEDLYSVRELHRVFMDTMSTTTIARLIILQGPTSSGKSKAVELLMRSQGERVVRTEASEAWADSPMSMLRAILQALGRTDYPGRQIERLEMVIELLNKRRRCLILEEAEHMGPRTLNLLKTLINNTPGEFVLVCVDILWRKLEKDAYEEARQLTKNRLAERIQLGAEVRPADVEKILSRRVVWAEGVLPRAVRMVLAKANDSGLLAFVRDVCTRANDMADDEPVTADMFAQAVNEEVKSR